MKKNKNSYMTEQEREVALAGILGTIDSTIVKKLDLEKARDYVFKKCKRFISQPSDDLLERIYDLLITKTDTYMNLEYVKLELYKQGRYL